jgi:plasmid stabilization system protein ParE
VKLRLSEDAQQDIERIDAWWRENRPAAPLLFLQELRDAIEQIEIHPESGTPYKTAQKTYRRVVLSWQAEHPGALWHGDVCHGPGLKVGNRSLYSRLHCRLNIDGHTPEDTADYIKHRLRKVGVKTEVFTSDAIAMLHEAALGSLRDVDRVATAALKTASRRRRKLVERDIIERLLDYDPER